MTENFCIIITKAGKQKMAEFMSGAHPVILTEMAIGNGDNNQYYEPDEQQTTRRNEKHSIIISSLFQDPDNPDQFIAEAVVGHEIGGFYIREVGLYDSVGLLFSISKFPETYKPLLVSGSGRELLIHIIFHVANSASIELSLGPSDILATRNYVDSRTAQYVEKNRKD